jgi:hypothetical protein
MSREQVIAYARTSKRNGAYVSLSGLIPEEELGE